MLAWQDMLVSDSMDRESDESEFEEDQELEGEQEESHDDDYAEYGEVGGSTPPWPIKKTHLKGAFLVGGRAVGRSGGN